MAQTLLALESVGLWKLSEESLFLSWKMGRRNERNKRQKAFLVLGEEKVSALRRLSRIIGGCKDMETFEMNYQYVALACFVLWGVFFGLVFSLNPEKERGCVCLSAGFSFLFFLGSFIFGNMATNKKVEPVAAAAFCQEVVEKSAIIQESPPL